MKASSITRAGAFVAIAAGLAVSNASATPIPLGGGAQAGIVSIDGLAGAFVGVNNTCINWGYPAACQTATGIQMEVSSLDPTVFTSGTSALDTIKDLPAGTTSLTAWQTIQSPLPGGVVTFDFTGLVIPGASGDCTSSAINNSCTPATSPFTLTQKTANQVAVSFAVTENAYTGSNSTGVTAYNGLFSTTLSGLLPNGAVVTIPNILAFVAGGGTITSTWNAQESPIASPTVPEPGTITMFLTGAGLLGISVFTKRRRKAV